MFVIERENVHSANHAYEVTKCFSTDGWSVAVASIEKNDSFNEHRRPVDNPCNVSKPTTVSEHFLTNDHPANDITLIPQELIKSN